MISNESLEKYRKEYLENPNDVTFMSYALALYSKNSKTKKCQKMK